MGINRGGVYPEYILAQIEQIHEALDVRLRDHKAKLI